MLLVSSLPDLASHCVSSAEGMLSAALIANSALTSRRAATSEDEGEGSQAVKKRQVSVLSPIVFQNGSSSSDPDSSKSGRSRSSRREKFRYGSSVRSAASSPLRSSSCPPSDPVRKGAKVRPIAEIVGVTESVNPSFSQASHAGFGFAEAGIMFSASKIAFQNGLQPPLFRLMVNTLPLLAPAGVLSLGMRRTPLGRMAMKAEMLLWMRILMLKTFVLKPLAFLEQAQCQASDLASAAAPLTSAEAPPGRGCPHCL